MSLHEEDFSLAGESRGSSPSRWGLKTGAVLGALGMAACIGVASLSGGASQLTTVAHFAGLQNKEDRIEITPSFWACSKGSDNCIDTGCCQVSGHKCFTKGKGKAQCNETCTPGRQGFTCDVVPNGNPSVPVAERRGQRLYCWAVYTAETGSPKPSTELDLLTKQKQYGVSLFACEQWDVFADVAVPLGHSDYVTIKVEDEFNEFHQIKRKETGTWVNWALFYQAWVKIREVGKWETTDWTVKVDADAVFVPQRLREWLGDKSDSPHGIYFENCPNVQYGFFGNLEVISYTGTKVLTKYLENCHAEFGPCANDGCDWKYGAWGEDVFAQRCMDHHYVDKVEAFDMSTDGACKADRPEGEKNNKKWHAKDCTQVTTPAAHPYKKVKDYFKCLGEMTGQAYTV